MLALQILMQHGHHADRKIPSDAAANLEKAQWRLRSQLRVPLREFHHVFDTAAHDGYIFNFATNYLCGKHIAERGIFPTRNKNGQVLFRCGDHPAVFWINLIELLEFSVEQNLVEELMW